MRNAVRARVTPAVVLGNTSAPIAWEEVLWTGSMLPHAARAVNDTVVRFDRAGRDSRLRGNDGGGCGNDVRGTGCTVQIVATLWRVS